jgi:hypothetical protein
MKHLIDQDTRVLLPVSSPPVAPDKLAMAFKTFVSLFIAAFSTVQLANGESCMVVLFATVVKQFYSSCRCRETCHLRWWPDCLERRLLQALPQYVDFTSRLSLS